MQNARVVSPRVIVTQNIITEEDDTFDAKTAPAPASTNTPENKSNVSTQNWAEPKKNQQVSRPEMKEQPIDKKPATTDKSSNQKSDNTDIEEITKKYDSQTKKKKKWNNTADFCRFGHIHSGLIRDCYPSFHDGR